MPKSSLPALVFNGVSLSIIRQNNQTYFSATDIAKSLGYQSDDAISRIYRRNADEFTADMSETVNLTVSGNIQKTVRLFSLRGAHLVAMFSRTSKAKEFRRWVLDILDKEVEQYARNTLAAVRILTTIEQTNINMRSHVLAQEKYREIRGELTSRQLSGYATSALEKNSVGFRSSDIQRRTPPSKRFFYVRGKSLFMGEPCGASSGAPGSFVTGLLIRTVSPTRLEAGSENSKRYKGVSHD